MKKFIKFFAIVIVLTQSFLLIGTLGAFAASDTEETVEIREVVSDSDDTIQRYKEYFEVTQSTTFWKYLPYSTITNSVICTLSKGDSLDFYSYYTDVYGNHWWYCKIINCAAATNLNGSYGYVSSSAVKSIIDYNS